MDNLYLVYFVILYMFRVYLDPSSGGTTLCIPGPISIGLSYWKTQHVCKQGDRTVDHLLYQCKLLAKQRGTLKKNIVHPGHWPISKHELITKFRKTFITFTESIDFDLL